MNGYTKGIKMGDNEPALWCLLIHFVSLPVMMGKPLGSIHEECEKVALQIEEASRKCLHAMSVYPQITADAFLH